MVGEVKKGQIFLADLNPVQGSEQGGVRPVVIIQNNIGNKFSPTVIVAAITGKLKKDIPTHVKLNSLGLAKESTVLLEQIRTIDKSRLIERIGKTTDEELKVIEEALRVSVDV